MTSTDLPDDDAGTSDDEPSSTPGRAGLVVRLGVAALVVAAAGLAGIASQFSGGGTQPHDVLPSDTVAYARIDLDPSASQKIAALRLIKKFPDLAHEVGVNNPDQDLRRLIVDRAARGCGLTFADDVEPWIGERAGIAAVGTAPDIVFALQVDDEDEARKTLSKLADCGDADNAGLSFNDGYAILAKTQDIADRTVADTKKATLADHKAFARDMDDLGNQGVASFWVDGRALTALDSVQKKLPPSVLAALPDQSTAAAALRAGASSLELDAVSHEMPFPDGAGTDIAALPASTALAVALRGSEDQIRSQWTQFVNTMNDDGVDSDKIGRFVSALGLRLPDDLVDLFSPGLTLAVGTRNVGKAADVKAPADIDALDVGLRIADPDAKPAADRLATFLRNFTGIELATATSVSNTVMSNHPEALQATGTSLGESQRYSDVVLPNAASTVLFLDLGTIIDALLEEDPPADLAADLTQAKPLGALGISTGRTGDVTHALIKVSFRD